MGAVWSVHRVWLNAPWAEMAALLCDLGSAEDQVWPSNSWPPMRFDAPLAEGVTGGHGPFRYVVETYLPGRVLRCRFTAPPGFDGTHTFAATPDGGGTWFDHRLELTTRGWARLFWPLVFGPLHDALANDAMVRAVRAAGGVATPKPWSLWVRILRLGR